MSRGWIRIIKMVLCFLLFVSVGIGMEIASQVFRMPISDTWIELTASLAGAWVTILTYWVIVFDVKKTRPKIWNISKYIGFFITFIILLITIGQTLIFFSK